MFKGFENLMNLGSLVKQAQEMGGKLKELDEKLRAQTTEATSAGGIVTVVVNGTGEILACRIDPKVYADGDRELVEDLIVSAVNQAITKAHELRAKSLESLGEGMQPGLSAALAQIIGKDTPLGTGR